MTLKKEKLLKWLKYGAYVLAGGAVLCTAGYVFLNNPGMGKLQLRSHFRKDGLEKVGYDSAIAANWQAVIDFVTHWTRNHPYKCPICDKFHLGHRH